MILPQLMVLYLRLIAASLSTTQRAFGVCVCAREEKHSKLKSFTLISHTGRSVWYIQAHIHTHTHAPGQVEMKEMKEEGPLIDY